MARPSRNAVVCGYVATHCMSGGGRLASVRFGRGQACQLAARDSQRARASIVRQDCALCTTPAWDLAVCWAGALPLV